jgi:hypothetical protein
MLDELRILYGVEILEIDEAWKQTDFAREYLVYLGVQQMAQLSLNWEEKILPLTAISGQFG